MINFIELPASVIESIIITEFTTRIMGFKSTRHKIIKYISYLLLSLLDIIILQLFVESDIVPGISHLVLTFGFAFLFLKGSILFKLFISVLSNVSILVINIAVMSIFSLFTQMDFNSLIANQTSTRILLLFITKFIYFLFTRLMLKIFKKEKYPLTPHNWYIIISLLLLSLAIGLIVFGINLYTTFNAVYIVITTVLIIVVNTTAYIIMIVLSKYNETKNRIAVLEQYQNEIDKKVSEINSKNKEVYNIKHEFNKNSLLMQKLIDQNKLSEAKNILSDWSDVDFGEDKQYVSLKHSMLETIINNELTMCSKESILIDKIDLLDIEQNLYGISEYDMCTIISNLLNNAIEACKKCKGEKSISLIITKEIDYIKIKTINSAETTNLAYNGKALKTSKKDKAKHGIGTQIINDLAIMYDGETDYKLKDNKFTATVFLSCANDVCKR